MKEIYHCFEVQVPHEKILQAVTSKTGIAGWWTKNLDYSGEPGSISTFRFSSGAFNKMRIDITEPNLIQWTCTDGNEEWIGSRVQFELKNDANKTKVCFSHFGFREQTEYVGECSFHWAYYMMSLQKFCETGEGFPNEGTQ